MNNKYEMEQNMIKFDDLIKVPIQQSHRDIKDQLEIDISLDTSNTKGNGKVNGNQQGEFNGEK